MKPLFIALTIISSFFAKNSNATNVSPDAIKHFENTFTNVKNVIWSVGTNLYKVQFSMNEQTVTAFYDEQGELMGVSRNITSLQLPLMLQTEIKNEYSKYWISDLFEMSKEEGTDYYITLEDADSKIVLKSLNNSSWKTYQKVRK